MRQGNEKIEWVRCPACGEYFYYYNNEGIISKLKMSPVKHRAHSLSG